MRARYLFSTVTILLLYYCYASQTRPNVGNGQAGQAQAVADSVDTLQTEQASDKWTQREIDSLAKPVSYFVGHLVDSLGRAVNRDFVKSLRNIHHFRMRDSMYVLRDTGCYRWYGTLGKTAADPDTIWLMDTCNTNPCGAWRWIPLNCHDSIDVSYLGPVRTTICDTVCSAIYTGGYDTSYYVLTDAQYASLKSLNGGVCSETFVVCMVRQPNNTWVINAKEFNTSYPRWNCAPCDMLDPNVCCVDVYQAIYFLGVNSIPRIDRVVLYEDTTEIDCDRIAEYYRTTKSITNCRDTTVAGWLTRKIGIEVPSGRDTLVYIPDTCTGCIKAYTVCEDGEWICDTTEVIRWRKIPVYDPVYDTSDCIRPYRIPVPGKVTYQPQDLTRDIDCDDAYAYINSLGASPTPVPGWVRVDFDPFTSGGYCRVVCTQDLPLPNPFSQSAWVDPAILPLHPVNQRPTCDTALCEPVWQTVYGNCCPKDTTVTVRCFDAESQTLIKEVTYHYWTPNLDIVCGKDTIRIVDSVFVRYDSVAVDTTLRVRCDYSGTRYVVKYVDTCACQKIICLENGCFPVPCTMFIRNECGRQPYWVGDTIVFPCSTELAASAMQYASTAAALLHDTILVLKDSLARLAARIPSTTVDSIAFEPWAADTLAPHVGLAICRTSAEVTDTLTIMSASYVDGNAITVKKMSLNSGIVRVRIRGALIDNEPYYELTTYRETATFVRKSVTRWYMR